MCLGHNDISLLRFPLELLLVFSVFWVKLLVSICDLLSIVICQRNGASLDTGQGALLGADTGISFHVLFVYVLRDLYKRYLGYCSLSNICSFYSSKRGFTKNDHGILMIDQVQVVIHSKTRAWLLTIYFKLQRNGLMKNALRITKWMRELKERWETQTHTHTHTDGPSYFLSSYQRF